MQKILQIFGLTVIMLLLSAHPAAANEIGGKPSSMATMVAEGVTDLFNTGAVSVKSGEPYDESKDPALHKSSPPEDGPKHGYFAVSLVVLGIVGLFIYFLKVD